MDVSTRWYWPQLISDIASHGHCYFKSCESDCVLPKLELIRVEGDAIATTCHYNHINQASPLLGKNCPSNYPTKGENLLCILSCFVHLLLFHQSDRCSHHLRRCSSVVQLYNNIVPMV